MVRDETGKSERTVAVYFDIDGTLLEKRRDEEEIVETAKAFDIELDDESVHEFDGLVEQYFRRNVADGYREAVETFTDHLGIDVDTDAFTRDLEWRKVENTRLADGAKDVLDGFSDVTVLGIITNGASDIQREKLARHGIADYFEHVLVSGELDTMKPKDEMFTGAKSERPADEYVYVADRLGDDLVPARQNGFVTVWISDEGSGVADVTVPSLAELTMEAVDDAL
ncbi:HAD family hydrolase [Haladaptatus sp. CMAA 1911]|uniref:HAD family hydrolase n=1 Tax=unclassified Haladaptatus TaxID=2622732 RepID=UPI00375436C9